jgi:predicted transposase/invertase (TIGR01784 family)
MLAKKHPEVGKAVKVLKTLSWSEQRRDIAFHKWLRRIDDETEKDEIREEGLAEGRAEAEEKARQDKLETARKLKRAGVSIEIIAENLAFSPEEIERL